MANLRCPCGNGLSNSGDSYNGGLLTGPQADYVSDGNADIWDVWKETWECPECGRLAIFDSEKSSNTPKWYLPEDGQPGHVLKGKNS